MDIFIVLAVFALSYALIKNKRTTENDYMSLAKERSKAVALPRGYNPYILNQFQEMKDRIFSADLRENRIETKPSIDTVGVYGITQKEMKLHPADATTIIHGPKYTLNV